MIPSNPKSPFLFVPWFIKGRTGRVLLPVCAVATCCFSFTNIDSSELVFFISGDTHGYLSPCGCSDPMSGGIRRRAAAIKALAGVGKAIVIDNGGWIAGTSRQDELKAEAIAESLRQMGVSAIALNFSELRLGKPEVESLSRLSGEHFVATSVHSESDIAHDLIRKGKLTIGSIWANGNAPAALLEQKPRSVDDSMRSLLGADPEAVPIVLYDGFESDAKKLARQYPAIRLVVYRSEGNAPEKPLRIGRTLLVTPGSKGRQILRIALRNGQFQNYRSIDLGPQFADDPQISRIYASYLRRVSREGLLEKIPRERSETYAGSVLCGSCHATALSKWRGSKHAQALKTLSKLGHEKDPDCVPCHVVGLFHSGGFRSVEKTPGLAAVGCESCHGPGMRHSLDPTNQRLAKLDVSSCSSCHNPENSPRFNFGQYWKKISH